MQRWPWSKAVIINNKMSKENNQNTPKKPRFSSWWVYGVIIALILGFQFFSGSTFSTTKKTTTSELQEYLRNGDIAKIVIIRNAGQAKVFLTEEALQKEVHRDVADKPMLPSSGAVPQYVLDYGDLQNFENDINEIKREQSRHHCRFWYRIEYSGRFVALTLALRPYHRYLDLPDAQDVERCRRRCWRADFQHR